MASAQVAPRKRTPTSQHKIRFKRTQFPNGHIAAHDHTPSPSTPILAREVLSLRRAAAPNRPKLRMLARVTCSWYVATCRGRWRARERARESARAGGGQVRGECARARVTVRLVSRAGGDGPCQWLGRPPTHSHTLAARREQPRTGASRRGGCSTHSVTVCADGIGRAPDLTWGAAAAQMFVAAV